LRINKKKISPGPEPYRYLPLRKRTIIYNKGAIPAAEVVQLTGFPDSEHPGIQGRMTTWSDVEQDEKTLL
jgi:hypothetical protein